MKVEQRTRRFVDGTREREREARRWGRRCRAMEVAEEQPWKEGGEIGNVNDEGRKYIGNDFRGFYFGSVT